MPNALASADVLTSLIPKPAPITDADWTPVEHWIKAALRRGKSTEDAESYRASCQIAKRQLWHLMTEDRVTGVVISEVYDHPDGLTVAMPVTAGIGLKDGIPAVLSMIEAWARDIGAKRLEGNGRAGWVRALKTYGFKPVRITIAKELT